MLLATFISFLIISLSLAGYPFIAIMIMFGYVMIMLFVEKMEG